MAEIFVLTEWVWGDRSRYAPPSADLIVAALPCARFVLEHADANA